jgi:ubiquinone/menaquinone biosynthesis C-methylase UbiE
MKTMGVRKTELVFWILLLMVLVTFGQEKRIPVEPGERRLNRLQQPEKIIDAIGLIPGMVIGDIGAGRGRLAVWFADRVGPEGCVIAEDIDKEALDYLKQRCQKHGIHNVTTILGDVNDPCLPQDSLDIAFMISVYHHLENPIPVLKNTLPSLKPDGILAIVEREPEKSGAPPQSSTPKETLIRQAQQAGFEIVRIETFLPDDNIYIFRPKYDR